MLTIFCCPKPFAGPACAAQRNAFASWRRVGAGVEILLIGNDPGLAEVAAEFGACHVAGVACNEYGTPLIPAVFALAESRAKHDLLAYANADIILLPDLESSLARVRFRRFLLVARRANIDTQGMGLWKSGRSDEESLRLRFADAPLDSPFAIDVFAFRRGSPSSCIPPFAVGRPGWDNWFVFDAHRRGLPVIDATSAVSVLHQRHDYAHVPAARGHKWEGPEADANRSLLGGPERLFSVSDAGWRMTGSRVVRNWCSNDSSRCAEILAIVRPNSLLAHAWSGSVWFRRLLTAWYELRIRLSRAGRGEVLPILKYPVWLAARAWSMERGAWSAR